jgi:PIN domain nuclease of toxin-antitoxin system
MRLLLDTHAFLWFIHDDPKLSAAARTEIEDGRNDVLVSAASHWEIAIKVGVGKLTLAEPFPVFIPREIERNDFEILPIELAHTSLVAALPHHHRDPFDRLLIAQAMAEGMPIVGADAMFDAYGVARLW